jgi:hypothetical protein
MGRIICLSHKQMSIIIIPEVSVLNLSLKPASRSINSTMSDSSINRAQIKKCLGLIEIQVGYGPTIQWTHRNFESLSASIEQKTGILISVSTLKRIWSSDFKSLPQKATLDALAQFIDFTDWFDFISSSEKKSHKRLKSNRIWIALVLLILVILSFIFIPGIINLKSRDSVDPGNSLIEIDERIVPVEEADSSDLVDE